ncbi:MAG: hypothetical protein AB7S52_09395 [Sphaerochaetaceae bacterium]
MKRIVCTIVLASVLCVALSASSFSFGVGNYARGSLLIENDFPMSEIVNPSSYQFGTDLRLRLDFIELTMTGVLTNNNALLDGIGTIGVNLPLFGLLDIGIGMGPYYLVHFDNNEVVTYRHFIKPNDSANWSYRQVGNFSEVITDSVVGYRAHADMRLGDLSFGISLDVPSYGYTFSSNTTDNIEPNFDKARIGASAMYWFL